MQTRVFRPKVPVNTQRAKPPPRQTGKDSEPQVAKVAPPQASEAPNQGKEEDPPMTDVHNAHAASFGRG